MIRIHDVRVEIDKEIAYEKIISQMIHVSSNQILDLELIKKSLDARDKKDIHYRCSFEFCLPDNEEKIVGTYKKLKMSIVEPFHYEIEPINTNENIVIVGSGPAGLFAAYLLAKAGAKPILIERGTDVDKRHLDVQDFWHGKPLKPNSSVQFGEGGAGTFSDGKLTSGIKDPRCRFVLNTFYQMGAPKEITYLGKPHIGTDYLMDVVRNMRNEIISLGGSVLFESQMTNIHIENNQVISIEITNQEKTYIQKVDTLILAIGHSARDTFLLLKEKGLELAQKNFSMGLRIEHHQAMLDEIQYGQSNQSLPASDYKLAVHLPNGRDLYTFCMCPGGMVVAATSEIGHVVTNGMSYFKRDMENGNSAILVGVTPNDFNNDDPLAGMYLQIELEKKAFELSKDYKAPVQLVEDFIANRVSTQFKSVKPSYLPGTIFTNFNTWLPTWMSETIKEGIQAMDKRMKGFAFEEAVLTGIESRSSSPVRIVRNTDFESNIKGIYPIGEGAGYAGGIMSSAVDGIKCYESLVRKYHRGN